MESPKQRITQETEVKSCLSLAIYTVHREQQELKEKLLLNGGYNLLEST
ncbi:hypothetical protein ACFLTQ_01570 [Chloroflexota bacterium]